MSGSVSEATLPLLVLPPTMIIGDIYSTADNSATNPLTGSFFYLEKMENPDPAPEYGYDEAGVVLKGE